MKSPVFLVYYILIAALAGCDFEDSDLVDDQSVEELADAGQAGAEPAVDEQPNEQPIEEPSTDNENPVTLPPPSNPPAPANTVFEPTATDIGDVDSFYDQDGYATTNVIRVDVRTVTTPGICTIDDQSGCTLADVIADTNVFDDFKVTIPIHVSADDFPDDGSVTNATLRQRGSTARLAPQKSFRIKLDSKDELWRNERRMQLNKHPYDHTRMRNKLAFELLRTIPHYPSLRTQYVNLWIDDGQGPVDYGLFTHIEFAGEQSLKNRGINKNDNLYKASFLAFSAQDLRDLEVDEDGQPVDIERFEKRLEIESGNDHRKLIEMLTAMSDPNRSFDSVLDQYFNRNNVLTRFAVNFVLNQADANTHNFYLYNPEGTERFYFLPWDFDTTFEPRSVPENSFDNDELRTRSFYGYAKGIGSEFITRYYQLPGTHQKILAAANELRANYLTDAAILDRAQVLSSVAEPFATAAPDNQHLNFNPDVPTKFVAAVNQLHADIRDNLDLPMPPALSTPTVDAGGFLQLRWEPAFDVTERNTITYDIMLANSPYFEANSIVYSAVNIPDAANEVAYSVNTISLPSGRLYARVVARASTDPARFWITNSDTYRADDGEDLIGVTAFDLP